MVDRLMEAEAEITRLHQERERWIDYTIDLQRIIEALCDRRGLPEPVSTARHHYNMAREHLAAERLAGARVKATSDELSRYIERCRELSDGGEYSWWSRLSEILSALAEPAGEAEPSKWSIPGSSYAGASTPPAASAIRDALERMLKEHDILSGNFGDVMDPKYARPDRWPTAAQKARAALKAAMEAER